MKVPPAQRKEGTDMNLTTCTVEGCKATFLWVVQRPRPDLCLEHGDEADRERSGWTPENSRD